MSTETNSAGTIQVSGADSTRSVTDIYGDLSREIETKFMYLGLLADGAISGYIRSLIISGPPGIGKSYTIQQKLEIKDPKEDTWSITRGYVRPLALYKMLYRYRFPGNVIVADDVSDLFINDDVALTILKAVCDTTKRRVVSWKTNAKIYEEDGITEIPKSFEYEGSFILLTNLDFDYLIARSHKSTPHLSALMSRSHYVDLELKTDLHRLLRIKQVIAEGEILKELNDTGKKEILEFLVKNRDIIRELSLRMVVKLKDLRQANPYTWRGLAQITCCRKK